MNIKDTIKNHKVGSLIVLLCIIVSLFCGVQVFSIMKIISPDVANLTEETTSVLLSSVIQKEMAPLVEEYKNQALILQEHTFKLEDIQDKLDKEAIYPVMLMAKEVETFNSAGQVDDRVAFLENNKWNAQLAAMEYLAENTSALETLREKVVYDEVFYALKAHILRY